MDIEAEAEKLPKRWQKYFALLTGLLLDMKQQDAELSGAMERWAKAKGSTGNADDHAFAAAVGKWQADRLVTAQLAEDRKSKIFNLPQTARQ